MIAWVIMLTTCAIVSTGPMVVECRQDRDPDSESYSSRSECELVASVRRRSIWWHGAVCVEMRGAP